MSGLEFRIDASDAILRRFGNQLSSLGNGLARQVMARALNHEGDKGRTAVKRVLVAQTGINYNLIEKGLSTHRASQSSLVYELRQRGSETNLGLFQARQTGSGVSAAPWNSRQIFRGDNPARGSFFLPGTKLVYVRLTKASKPIKPLYGPNLAREIVKDKSRIAWERVPRTLADRVAHEINRVLV